MPRLLGDAFIAISPETAGFRPLLDAEVKKAIAGLRPVIRFGADVRDVNSAIADLKTRMETLSRTLADVKISGDDTKLEATVAKAKLTLIALAKTVSSVAMGADTSKLDAAIYAEKAKLAALFQKVSDLKMDANTTAAVAKIAALEKEAFHLRDNLDTLTLDVDVTASLTRIYAIEAELKVLRADAERVRLAADKSALDAAITASRHRIAELTREASGIRMNVDIAGLTAANTGLLALEATVAGLAPKIAAGDAKLGAFGTAITGLGRGWGILGGNITLFGGLLNRVLPVALSSVKVWHAAADALIEIGAVIIPAGIALAAFGIAGSDAAKAVATQMQNAHVILDATGQAAFPLTHAMENLHKAVQPQVYQLFGDAIAILGAKTGEFATIAKGAGTVVDQLAARFTVAITSGTGMSAFLKNAVPDLAKVGDIIGNLGGAFGNFFNVIPGIATKLLSVADALSKVAETATRIAEPVLRVVLALHGYLLWTGLAVTASLAFIGALANLGRLFVTFAAGTVLSGVNALRAFGTVLTTIALSIASYVQGIVKAQGASATFAAVVGRFGPLLANPVTWAAALGVAFIALGLAFGRTRDQAQKFNDTMQQMVRNAQLGALLTTISTAQAASLAQVAARTADASKAMTAYRAQLASGAQAVNLHTGATTRQADALAGASRQLDEAVAGNKTLNDQYALVSTRLGRLGKDYGGTTGALGALTAAGITTDQMLDKSNEAWLQIQVQVRATQQAYLAMGASTGQASRDLQILGAQSTDTYSAIQKLNQGIDTFISNVLAAPQSLNTMEQGFATLAADTGNFTLHLGQLKLAGTNSKVAIDSLTDSSGKLSVNAVNLSQAFFDQVSNINKWADSLRLAGLSQNEQADAMKAAIGPLLDTASGSTTATAALQALAYSAGGPATGGIKALRDWVGKLGGSQAVMQTATDDATTAMLRQTTQARDLSTAIATQLTTAMQQAVFAANGGQAVFDQFAQAVKHTGATGIQTQAAANNLAIAIIGMLGDTTAAKQTFEAFAMRLHLTQQQADALWDNFKGSGAAALGGVAAKAESTRDKFNQLALHFRLTQDQADQLWAKLRQQNLDTLAGKADTTRAKFDDLARKGLHLTHDQADQLWVMLRTQYLDTLATKAGVTRGQFEKLAHDGLGLTRDQADQLWARLRLQYLDAVATKAGETKGQFERLAAQLGVTRGDADKLWGSLHRLADGSPYLARVAATISGHGSITANSTLIGSGSQNLGELVFKREGGKIPGFGGGDSVMAMLEPGELVIPKNYAGEFGGMARRRGIPGFAAGGLAGNLGADIASAGRLPSFASGADDQFSLAAAQAWFKGVNQAASTMFAGTPVPNVGSGVARWKGTVDQALAMEGLPLSLDRQVLFQIQTESGGNPNAINLSDINAQRGDPSKGLLQTIGCVPLNTRILTRRGWLAHDEVRAGDETLGCNPATGRSEWTPVTAVQHYGDAEVWRIGNKHWHADVTPGHRWWSDTQHDRSPEKLAACPECGWAGRGNGIPCTPRSVSTHRGRVHGIQGPVTYGTRGEFTRTDGLRSGHRLRLAAPADTGGIPGLTLEEAAILGWIMGDGHAQNAYRQPVLTCCPECGRLPGTGRKPGRGPVAAGQESNSIAVHRAKAHGVPGHGNDPVFETEDAGWDASIYQSKPEGVTKLRALLARVPHTENTRERGLVKDGSRPYYPAHEFKLTRAYATELLKRAQYGELSPEEFVLALSPGQREAWLGAMIDAEGHTEDGFTRISQVDGPMQDAITLAVYLEGWRPTYSRIARHSDKHQPAGHIGMARPHAAPSMFGPHEVLERQPVWCVTTGLGTWTMRQDGGQPCLTGNSTFRAYHWPGTSGNIYDPLANIAAAINYARHVYGPALMRGGAGLGSGHGYALGGIVGGMVPGMASGGLARTLAAWQGREQADYAGLRKAFFSGPRKYLTTLTRDELSTLANRQASEQLAYRRLAGAGMTPHNLSLFATATAQESRVARDQALNRHPGGHPGWAHGLEAWLGALGSAASGGAAGGKGGPGTPPDPAAAAAAKLLAAQNALLAADLGFMHPTSLKLPSFGYDSGGMMPPGLSLAWNGTGQPEPVGEAGMSGLHAAAIITRLDRLIKVTEQQGPAFGAVLSSVAGRASSRGYYGR